MKKGNNRVASLIQEFQDFKEEIRNTLLQKEGAVLGRYEQFVFENLGVKGTKELSELTLLQIKEILDEKGISYCVKKEKTDTIVRIEDGTSLCLGERTEIIYPEELTVDSEEDELFWE